MSRCSGQINGFISASEVDKKRLKEHRGLKRRYFIEFVTSFGYHTVFRNIVLYTFEYKKKKNE